MNKFNHIPVLLNEAVESLSVKKNHKYIDATAGGGGHIDQILKKGGVVLAIDQDEAAVSHLKKRFGDCIIVKSNFNEIGNIAKANGFNLVSGILFDLGVSSYQLDQSERGFRVSKNERLDMRMDMSNQLTAHEIVNRWSEMDLIEIFKTYGEVHSPEIIAERIVKARRGQEIETTFDLIKILDLKGNGKIHPATTIFQAIRIAVNNELEHIKTAIRDGLSLLIPNGRMVVISFHSLEDRIVKRLFREFELEGSGKEITKKPVRPSETEVYLNRRSRSAKMRVFEKI